MDSLNDKYLSMSLSRNLNSVVRFSLTSWRVSEVSWRVSEVSWRVSEVRHYQR